MRIQKDWLDLLKEEFNKEYFLNLKEWINEQYVTRTIYPAKENIFNALLYTSYKDTKVVILGQDPYYNGVAHGLSFSVIPGVSIPKSLANIYKELQTDLGCFIPNNGNLEKWARQGVLLLNTSLTVEAGNPNSHQGKGWEIFTDKIIHLVNQKLEPTAFILWGNNARSKKAFISNPQHLIIESPHPSPLSASRGFFGSRPFSKVNEFLEVNNRALIDWQIENL